MRLLLSIILLVASLTETLGTAKPSRSYSYNYTPPRIESPYPRYPTYRAQTPEQGSPFPAFAFQQNQAQSMKPIPSTTFQAEYNYDPILARISQMGEMAVANARTEAAALKKRAFIEAGDADIARELGADQNTLDAAAANPFSTAKMLQKDFTDRGVEMDNALNQQNLFYSGHRADKLGEMETNRARAHSDWSQVLRDLLAQVNQGVMTAEENERRRQLAAAASARPPGYPYPPPPGAAPPPPGQEPPGETPWQEWDNWEAPPIEEPYQWEPWYYGGGDPLLYGLGGARNSPYNLP